MKKETIELNESQLRNIIREAIINELNISTTNSAYNKMQRYGEYNRAKNLSEKSKKIVYCSDKDNLMIYKKMSISSKKLCDAICESIYHHLVISESIDELNAYHGSYTNFDRFKLDNNTRSSGEGSTATPWGVYVTSKKEIANYYSRTVSRKNNYDEKLGVVKDNGWVYTIEIPDEKNYNYLIFNSSFNQERQILYILNQLVTRGVIDRYTFGYLYKCVAPYKISQNDNVLKGFNNNLSLGGNIKNGGFINGIKNYWNTKKGSSNVYQEDIKITNIAQFYNLLGATLLRKQGNNTNNSTSMGNRLASEALYKAGFVGIKIPTGYYGHSSYYGEYNYVIFNPNDIKIISKEPTPNGDWRNR